MYLPFNQLNNNARVWVYLCNRKFTADEINDLEIRLKNFVEQWTAHKKDLAASFSIYNGVAIILAVDETQNDASGCSIDSSVRIMKEIEQTYNVELFNRQLVAFQKNDQFEVINIDLFKKKLESGEINNHTNVLNTLVNTKAEINSNFVVPLNKSWHQQLIN